MKVCSVIPRKYNNGIHINNSDSEDGDMFIQVFRCSLCKLAYFDTMRQLQRHKRQSHLKRRRRSKAVLFKRLLQSSYSEESSSGYNDEEDDGDTQGSVVCMDSDASNHPSVPETTKAEEDRGRNNGRKFNRWKCHLKVVLEKLRYYEIYISTPAKGFREIYYTGKAINTHDSDSSCSDNLLDRSLGYEEWRLEKIKALPMKSKPPELPSVTRPTLLPIPKPSSKHTAPTEKHLLLEIPSELSHMFNVNGRMDNLHSILDVITGQKMSNLVLEAYLIRRISCYNNEINAGIRSAYKLRPILKTKFFLLSIQFLLVYRKSQNPLTLEPKLCFMPSLPLDEDFVLIAPLFTCNHFYLAIFDARTKSVYVYDSAWHFVSNELRLAQVKKILITVFSRSPHKWTIYFRFDCAQQIDETSCGCYVVYFAENHLKGKNHRCKRQLNKTEVQQIRTDMATELLPTTKYGSQVLEALSE